MLQLHEPIDSDDPDALLQYERGVFELVSPSGERLRVVCPQGIPLGLTRAVKEAPERARRWWRIEKVAEV